MATTDLSVLADGRTVDDFYEDFIKLRRAYLPTYTNRDQSDPGNILARLFSGVADYLHLRHDLEQAQTIPSRVERRESARAILQAMGTDFTPRSAATADVTVSITGDSLPTEDIPLGQYHVFSAPGPGVRFVIPAAGTYWPSGARSKVISVMHGEDSSATVGTTDGSENQFFDIDDISDIVQNDTQRTVRVFVGDVEYLVVDDFSLSGPTDTHAQFKFLDSGRGRIVLGNNRLGIVPAEGLDVVVRAISGGGVAGNVGEDTITSMLTPLMQNGTTFAVTVTNALAASGGTNEQTIRDAMLINPQWWRAQDRCVAGADTAALAKKVPGVLDAASVRTGVTVVTTYILADSATGYPSTQMLNDVDGYLTTRGILTDDHIVSAPTIVPVDVEITVRRRKRANAVLTKAAVEAATANFFDLRQRKDAGQVLFTSPDTTNGFIYTSDFIGFLEAIPAVDSVDLTRFVRTVAPVYQQWTGSAAFSTVEVTNDAVRETVTVRFVSPTQYVVSGSVSGELGLGTIDTEFSGGGMFTFTLTNPTAVAMVAGDYAEFRVDNSVSNFRGWFGEVPILGALTVTLGDA